MNINYNKISFQKQLQIDKDTLLSSISSGKFNENLNLIFSILTKTSYDFGYLTAEQNFNLNKNESQFIQNNSYSTLDKLSFSEQLSFLKNEIINSISNDKFNDVFSLNYQLINKIYYDNGYTDFFKHKNQIKHKI